MSLREGSQNACCLFIREFREILRQLRSPPVEPEASSVRISRSAIFSTPERRLQDSSPTFDLRCGQQPAAFKYLPRIAAIAATADGNGDPPAARFSARRPIRNTCSRCGSSVPMRSSHEFVSPPPPASAPFDRRPAQESDIQWLADIRSASTWARSNVVPIGYSRRRKLSRNILPVERPEAIRARLASTRKGWPLPSTASKRRHSSSAQRCAR